MGWSARLEGERGEERSMDWRKEFCFLPRRVEVGCRGGGASFFGNPGLPRYPVKQSHRVNIKSLPP